MNYKKEIIRGINSLSGSRSPYEVFCGWVKCSALAIQNQLQLFRRDAVWQRREEEYIAAIRPYGSEGEEIFARMAFDFLPKALEEDMRDVLGEVYMEAGLGNKNTGQFFTPFHVSYAMAKMSVIGEDGSRIISMNEPSCGAGGMVIATAKALKDNGVNYQKCLRAVAQDLDWKAVYMCYLQLSLLGIRAVVAQGDTLLDPYVSGNYPSERVFRTPAQMGLLPWV